MDYSWIQFFSVLIVHYKASSDYSWIQFFSVLIVHYKASSSTVRWYTRTTPAAVIVWFTAMVGPCNDYAMPSTYDSALLRPLGKLVVEETECLTVPEGCGN